ncbi:MAG: AraC family transcriptional regulator [Pyrinomonadaceae bacterium]
MNGRIFKLKAEISRSLQEQWTVAKMAAAADLSEPHFIRLFRTEIKTTPFEYLTCLRMEQAKNLLENTFLRIKEIGVNVGIPNESQFSREFRKRFSLTPTEYRHRHWEIEQSNPPDVQE